jgi:wyosine [tRNA(Phe)-imidazoG37] synthetase (radical SAM superfamily)
MKASEIVDKFKSILLSSETDEVKTEEVNEIEVNEPVELGYDDKKEGMEDMPSEDVVEEVEDEASKFVTKDELDAAMAEMKAMYDKLMEQMGTKKMETEVPSEELSKEELSSQVEEVEPIAHTPEVATEVKQNIRLASKRPMSTIDRVFAQLNQIKR